MSTAEGGAAYVGRSPSVSIVVPCLNEEHNLPHVFGRLPADVDEVVLVDGGSVDRTVERARELRPSVKIVYQTRRGKGNALVCGFEACTSDIIVMLDADGSTDPAEVPLFVKALIAGADFVKGSRFLPGGGSHDITRIRRTGNWALVSVVNALFRARYSDLCYGYNAFWRSLVPYLDLPDSHTVVPDDQMLWGDGFEIEALINVRVAVLGLRVGEVPSVEAARIHGVSNLSAFRDGRRVLRTVMREHRRRRRGALAPIGEAGTVTGDISTAVSAAVATAPASEAVAAVASAATTASGEATAALVSEDGRLPQPVYGET